MIKRIIKTDLLYTSVGEPLQNGMVSINEHNVIVEVGKNLFEKGVGVGYYEGAICAGFVNAHCHLELSHLKGKVKQKTGITGFIQELQQLRNAEEEEKQQAIEHADKLMAEQGIVAVGDISNGDSTFSVKKKSEIHYHTFLELFGFSEKMAEEIFNNGLSLKEEAQTRGLAVSIVPHSPYTVSEKLFGLIRAEENNVPLCIHNQESAAENEMFEKGSGKIVEMMESFGIDMSRFEKRGKSSLRSFLKRLPPDVPLQLVHNTFTAKPDMLEAEKAHKKLYWCFCPKANLYIEGRLPDIPQFVKAGVQCTIGTDSLASNNSLSVWEEIQIIKKNYPEIEMNELIKWATINGARLLKLEKKIGSIEPGKEAKLNHLKNNKVAPLKF